MCDWAPTTNTAPVPSAEVLPDDTLRPLWKMQVASIAAEQIQELSAEVERLRQQLSSTQATLDGERLVDAVYRLAVGSTRRDGPQLAYVETFYFDPDSAQKAGVRTLVLAALGMEVHRGEQEAPATAPAQ